MSETNAKVHFEGRVTTFHVANKSDHIQAFHRRGSFYELSQLLQHRSYIPMGSTVIDVGANIGNHSIFYAQHTWAKSVYTFEPNPVARSLLLKNIALNGDYRAQVKIDHVHLALGKEPGVLRIAHSPTDNLGGSRLGIGSSEDPSAISCVRLDSLSFEGEVSFLKIDVEGMELEVLTGAAGLISRYRPTIAIEVQRDSEAGFWAWVRENQYMVIAAFFEYLNVKNYIAIPLPQ